MTNRERLLAVLHRKMPTDHLPVVEWAPWWDLTAERWYQEGAPKLSTYALVEDYFHMEPLYCFSVNHRTPALPARSNEGIIHSRADYEQYRKYLLSRDMLTPLLEELRAIKPRHDRGEVTIRIWFDGFFWYPRTLFGIEPHLYAFYDEPELMHRMNRENLDYYFWALEEICKILTPDFMTFAEDMSYNHGPMLSEACFRDFIEPYYRVFIPALKDHDITVIVDTDGDLSEMIPWLIRAGVDGALPLERQAGVDIPLLKRQYPDFIFIGGYDKMIMHKGEAAMRAEFERLLPAMRAGGYIPSVDHQTPPDVSLENYKIYVRLLREYCEKAVQ